MRTLAAMSFLRPVTQALELPDPLDWGLSPHLSPGSMRAARGELEAARALSLSVRCRMNVAGLIDCHRGDGAKRYRHVVSGVATFAGASERALDYELR